MDLTSLNQEDTDEKIHSLCDQALSPAGWVAAVCIYPRFIAQAKYRFKQIQANHIKVATVVNFPSGDATIEQAQQQTRQAIELGADEVDMVLPYRQLMAGDNALCGEMVTACKAACGDHVLKVILETGELSSEPLIRTASDMAIHAGADFIKTSTGKVPINATLEASRIMLEAIKSSGKAVGFKAAGGVRTAQEAQQYLQLAANIMGEDWITPECFRFGASSLLNNLLTTLGQDVITNLPSHY
jgi:deoxyribose-phosphate aldolase